MSVTLQKTTATSSSAKMSGHALIEAGANMDILPAASAPLSSDSHDAPTSLLHLSALILPPSPADSTEPIHFTPAATTSAPATPELPSDTKPALPALPVTPPVQPLTIASETPSDATAALPGIANLIDRAESCVAPHPAEDPIELLATLKRGHAVRDGTPSSTVSSDAEQDLPNGANKSVTTHESGSNIAQPAHARVGMSPEAMRASSIPPALTATPRSLQPPAPLLHNVQGFSPMPLPGSVFHHDQVITQIRDCAQHMVHVAQVFAKMPLHPDAIEHLLRDMGSTTWTLSNIMTGLQRGFAAPPGPIPGHVPGPIAVPISGPTLGPAVHDTSVPLLPPSRPIPSHAAHPPLVVPRQLLVPMHSHVPAMQPVLMSRDVVNVPPGLAAGQAISTPTQFNGNSPISSQSRSPQMPQAAPYSPTEYWGSERSNIKRRKRLRPDEVIQCRECGTTETPEWRRGPSGARTLCNACGLHHAKQARKGDTQQAIERTATGTRRRTMA